MPFNRQNANLVTFIFIILFNTEILYGVQWGFRAISLKTAASNKKKTTQVESSESESKR